eukprot:CAMPEP_0178436728 /NCGR_PEP_ID=MMETSP0689_2-20121128/34591_1 /TAXON_ID=160604 /ORGANISM="Amphidinium massartii, Strain CS-259" /LENGTH=102 /DNA_ID=CAMNT_0020058837 /DNA_START=156 /DNA_END=464 /DNA_ORIENTATION=+
MTHLSCPLCEEDRDHGKRLLGAATAVAAAAGAEVVAQENHLNQLAPSASLGHRVVMCAEAHHTSLRNVHTVRRGANHEAQLTVNLHRRHRHTQNFDGRHQRV